MHRSLNFYVSDQFTFYHPQTKFRKAMFLVVPVSLSVCSGRSQCDHYLDLFKLVQLGAPGPGLLPNHKRTLHPTPGTTGKQTVGIRLKWLPAVHIYITQLKAILAANFFISFHSWVCHEESISITCSLQIYLSTSKPLLCNISVMIDYSASLLVASWKGWLTPWSTGLLVNSPRSPVRHLHGVASLGGTKTWILTILIYISVSLLSGIISCSSFGAWAEGMIKVLVE